MLRSFLGYSTCSGAREEGTARGLSALGAAGLLLSLTWAWTDPAPSSLYALGHSCGHTWVPPPTPAVIADARGLSSPDDFTGQPK